MEANKYTVIIIGGGAAGIFAAIAAKTGGNLSDAAGRLPEVIILEKMPRIGTKLMIAGGGRCNITHNFGDNVGTGRDLSLQGYYPAGGKFLYSSFSKFGPKETLDFFHYIGIKTFEDRGGRIFPECENAVKVVEILENYLRKQGIKIMPNSEVMNILKNAEKFTIKTKGGQTYAADKLILTTGGKSYPKTGSTGDGFNFAQKFGHTVIPPLPSLVPLETKEKWVKDLQGLTLKNAEAKIIANKKQIASKFGDMLFTHFGLSGPIILYLSRAAVNLLNEGNLVKISIDLKPALSEEKLDARLRREFASSPKKQFKNILANLLPQKMIPVFARLSGVSSQEICAGINAEQRKKIIRLLKNFEFTIEKDMGFYYAEVTQGGVDLSEVNPRTMESKIAHGLYFAGEILDIDGYIGGFNLQAAFSTGFMAGLNAAK